ncbi:MAG: FUSC family protein [Bacteroidota bacterium]
MQQKPPAQLTDAELQQAAKKLKSDSIWSALLIGFMVGIVIFSIVKNTWGFLTLIPLYFIYKMVNGDKKNASLREEIKKRNLE